MCCFFSFNYYVSDLGLQMFLFQEVCLRSAFVRVSLLSFVVHHVSIFLTIVIVIKILSVVAV